MLTLTDGPLQGRALEPPRIGGRFVVPVLGKCASPGCLYLHLENHLYTAAGAWVSSSTSLGLRRDDAED